MDDQRKSQNQKKFENEQNVETDQCQQSDEALQKSKSLRYKKCPECEEYYEVIDQKSNHSCIDSLKKRIEEQQAQISNMVTKEEVAEILKGYVPHDTFLNFIRTTEKKFSELFHNVNNHEDMLKGQQKQEKMRCPEGHDLFIQTGQRLRSISCDICEKKAQEQGNHTARCETCNYDVCAICEYYLKEIKCKKGHQLQLINHQDYDELECDKCSQDICSKSDGSFRCEKCDFDICKTCFLNKLKELQQKKKQENSSK